MIPSVSKGEGGVLEPSHERDAISSAVDDMRRSSLRGIQVLEVLLLRGII